jgi:hypothetical protein
MNCERDSGTARVIGQYLVNLQGFRFMVIGLMP